MSLKLRMVVLLYLYELISLVCIGACLTLSLMTSSTTPKQLLTYSQHRSIDHSTFEAHTSYGAFLV